MQLLSCLWACAGQGQDAPEDKEESHTLLARPNRLFRFTFRCWADFWLEMTKSTRVPEKCGEALSTAKPAEENADIFFFFFQLPSCNADLKDALLQCAGLFSAAEVSQSKKDWVVAVAAGRAVRTTAPGQKSGERGLAKSFHCTPGGDGGRNARFRSHFRNGNKKSEA
ncbi:hypothetical protein GQ43DRAFT_148550 [Delitschia confertaspora ATCC 74209]|uniref:Uncharacterized protein n=1 Tax=Delitschia confertaspora ATCC 74209 TaxID=1513339 RepID=A0A9P4JFV9_9PLEO|nr:hypothetical protein GQ43DRAFT_148550 [Delitschia confertaspora ATCC 74209]